MFPAHVLEQVLPLKHKNVCGRKRRKRLALDALPRSPRQTIGFDGRRQGFKEVHFDCAEGDVFDPADVGCTVPDGQTSDTLGNAIDDGLVTCAATLTPMPAGTANPIDR